MEESTAPMMDPHAATARKTFRVTLDIEATFDPSASDDGLDNPAWLHAQRALADLLIAHPEMLRRLLRATAVGQLDRARRLFDAEYGWGRLSEQAFFQTLVAELDDATRAVLVESGPGDEGFGAATDGASEPMYYFEACAATITRWSLSELDEAAPPRPSDAAAIRET